MKAKRVLLTSLFLCLPLFAQNPNCDSIVLDQTGALRGQTAQVEEAAKGLINEGADVRVRVESGLIAGNLDNNEAAYERNCGSWKSPNGGRKSTLLVLMVAPSQHKMGMYYGSAFNKALTDHWNRIKQENMGPRFHDGDFVGGLVSAERALTARIAASKDEAVHPTQSVVNNNVAASDLSGLWKVLGAIVLIGFIVLLVWLLYKRKQLAEEVQEMKTKAISAKARVARLILEYGADSTLSANPRFQSISEAYASLAANISSDPSQDGLSKGQYGSLYDTYSRYEDQLRALKYPASTVNKTDSKYTRPKTSHTTHEERSSSRHWTSPAAQPPAPTTVVVNNSNDGFVEGALLGSMLSRDREDREYREPARPTRISRDDDDDNSGGGGSSSWSSSDSSSSSDFGGSSDFSSSDSGGGGSSDF